MKTKSIVQLFLLFSFIEVIFSEEIFKDKKVSLTSEQNSTTKSSITDASLTKISEVLSSSSEPISSSTTTNTPEESPENLEEGQHIVEETLPFHNQRRKILYVNQQQSGKFNVHLELNDVNLVVIPQNKKDPHLSLLNLLLRSAAQKSNVRKEESSRQKVKETTKIVDTRDAYSMENDEFKAESRLAPYKVDISSKLGQGSPVEIIPNSNLMSRSPPVKFPKPSIQRIFKRSINTRFDNFNYDSPILSDHSISSNGNNENELTESITNSLDNNEGINTLASTDESFILLGAVENCGPGRRRNSYQICVNDDSQ